jgi:hypothetical protein
MSKKELKDYFQWFMGMSPERVTELTGAVTQTPGFESWRPDGTSASLAALGDWLANTVETRQRSSQELQEIEGRLSFPIDGPDWELTNKSFSVAMDAAMYLSQVFLTNYALLRWSQEFGNKKNTDFGQPVLIGFGSVPLNPVQIMVTMGYGFADKSRAGGRLREVYDYWAERARANV